MLEPTTHKTGYMYITWADIFANIFARYRHIVIVVDPHRVMSLVALTDQAG